MEKIMKKNLLIATATLLMILNACSKDIKQQISGNINTHRIPMISTLDYYKKQCPKQFLCSYLPWLIMDESQVKEKQMEYGLTQKPKIVHLNRAIDTDIYKKNIDSISHSVQCINSTIDQFVVYKNKAIFACKYRSENEFRFVVYLSKTLNDTIYIYTIDSGGGSIGDS